MGQYVTLETYNTPEEAYIVKGMLADEGIPAVVQDNNNLYVPVFNGVDLLVPQEDYEKASKLIKEHDD